MSTPVEGLEDDGVPIGAANGVRGAVVIIVVEADGVPGINLLVGRLKAIIRVNIDVNGGGRGLGGEESDGESQDDEPRAGERAVIHK